jgi:hypothetical protein
MAQNVGLYVKLNSGSYVSQIKVGWSEINIWYSYNRWREEDSRFMLGRLLR